MSNEKKKSSPKLRSWKTQSRVHC